MNLYFISNISSRYIPARPTHLQTKSTRISIHIQNLSCKVEVFMYSRFHSFTINLIGIHSASSYEFVSRTTFYKSQRNTISEKSRYFFSISFSDRYRICWLDTSKILLNECFCKSPGKFLSENTGNQFFGMIRKLLFQKWFPFHITHRGNRSKIDYFYMIFIYCFPSKFGRGHKSKWPRYTKMCKQKCSLQFSDFRRFKCKPREFMCPLFTREPTRKRWSKLRNSMS